MKKNLPDNKSQDQIVRKGEIRTEHYSGPLPHPAILKQYDEICPGAAERIIKMAEKQSEHRQLLEKDVISSDIRNSRLGLYSALIIALVGFGSTVVCAFLNQPIIGSVTGGGTLVTIVTAFIYGTNSRRKEREQKNKDIKN